MRNIMLDYHWLENTIIRPTLARKVRIQPFCVNTAHSTISVFGGTLPRVVSRSVLWDFPCNTGVWGK